MLFRKTSRIALVAILLLLTLSGSLMTSTAQEPNPPDMTKSGPDHQVDEAGFSFTDRTEPLGNSGEVDIPDAPVKGSALVGGEIVVSALNNEQFLPAVAYNSKHHEYLVVWHNTWGANADIYARRVNDRGQVLSWFTVVSDPKDTAWPSVAYDPVHDRYLVVWTYDVFGDASDWDLWGRFIPWNGPDAGLTEFPIALWNTSQWYPKVAYARAMEEFMVVWTNTYNTGTPPAYVSAVRINAGNGNVGGAFTIDTHATQSRVNPDIAYNLARNEYLVVWEAAGGGSDIWGLRMTGAGNFLGGGKFGIAGWPSSEERPAVGACSAADRYYVAWQSYQGTNNYDVYGRFVAGNGSPGAVHHFDHTPINERNPDVDCNLNSKEFLVVFESQYSNPTGPYGVAGQPVTPAGLGNPFKIRGIRAGEGTSCSQPAVAGGGTNYLTVWEHDRPGTSFQDIHGRLVTTHPMFLPMLER